MSALAEVESRVALRLCLPVPHPSVKWDVPNLGHLCASHIAETGCLTVPQLAQGRQESRGHMLCISVPKRCPWYVMVAVMTTANTSGHSLGG